MIKVTDVQPRDFYITLEISLEAANQLLQGLGQSEISIDITKPDTVQAKEMVEKFFKVLNEVVEGLEKDGIRPDGASC